jgi:hypothetical protein
LFPSNTQQIALPAAGTSAKAHTSKVPASRSREPTARYKWLITQPRAEFAAIRMEHLAAHPTVKPVSLVADALLDCTARGDVVLDQFAGSGYHASGGRKSWSQGIRDRIRASICRCSH